MQPDAAVARLQLLGGLEKLAYSLCLAGTDVDVSADGIAGLRQLLLRPIHQEKNFLRPLAQQHPFLRKGDFSIASDHQLLAQLFLQLPQLPGEGGLG